MLKNFHRNPSESPVPFKHPPLLGGSIQLTDSWGHYSLAGNGCQEGDRKPDSSLNPSHHPVSSVCVKPHWASSAHRCQAVRVRRLTV